MDASEVTRNIQVIHLDAKDVKGTSEVLRVSECYPADISCSMVSSKFF